MSCQVEYENRNTYRITAVHLWLTLTGLPTDERACLLGILAPNSCNFVSHWCRIVLSSRGKLTSLGDGHTVGLDVVISVDNGNARSSNSQDGGSERRHGE